MKKKTPYLIVITAILVIGAIAFFRPLSLVGNASGATEIKMFLNEMGIEDGKPEMDISEIYTLTSEQKTALSDLQEDYTYRRTFSTPFSDGSISGLGDKLLYLYVYEGVELTDCICISSSGKVAVNDKTYIMKNADQFIDKAVELMNMNAE